MDCDNFFKLDLTLAKLSLVAVAVELWSLPNVQEKVQIYFQIKQNLSSTTGKWDEVVDYVIECGYLLPLPEILLCEVRSYLILIGDKMHNWIEYAMRKIGFDFECIKKIYWTLHGNVDDLKIVKQLLLEETGFAIRKNFDSFDSFSDPLVKSAVFYAREDFIEKHQNLIKKELIKKAPEELRKIWSVHNIICAGQILLTNRRLFPNPLFFMKRDNTFSAKKLLLNSIINSYEYGAKYFFKKLNINKKQTIISEAAKKCLDSLEYLNGYQEKIIEILIFLLNEMSVIQVTEFVTKHFFSVFKNFLKVWPYQEFCLNLLNQSWKYSPGDMKKSLKLILKYLSCTKKWMLLRNKCIYRNILEKLLQRTSKDVKLQYFGVGSKNKFHDRFKNFDLLGLILILNDSDLQEHRDNMLSYCKDIFTRSVLDENYKDLNKVMDIVYSDKEKELFKYQLNVLPLFLMNGQLQSADEHLIWLFDSDEDRQAAKKQIDSLEIVRNLVRKYKFDLAEKFLLWGLDSVEERQIVKRAVYESDKWIRDEIYKIWGASPIDRAIKKCSEMLKWFLESEEAVVEFKANKIIKNDLFLVKYWRRRDSFHGVEKFLKFCFRTDEEIEGLKTAIGINIIWWIDSFISDETDMVLALLDWIFNDLFVKKEMIANYMNSSKGALACNNIFQKYSKDRREVIVKFFNTCFDKSLSDLNIYEMKKNLNSFDEAVVVSGVKSCILKLLVKKRKGETIKVRDLPEDVNDLHDFIGYEPEYNSYSISDVDDDSDSPNAPPSFRRRYGSHDTSSDDGIRSLTDYKWNYEIGNRNDNGNSSISDYNLVRAKEKELILNFAVGFIVSLLYLSFFGLSFKTALYGLIPIFAIFYILDRIKL